MTDGGYLGNDPHDWKEFAERNPVFVERLPHLKELVERALSRELDTGGPAGAVIIGSVGLCAHDYAEIVCLAINGHGSGALKLLRPLYEHAILGAYLSSHRTADAEAQEFIKYHPVQEGKRAGQIVRSFKGILPEDRMEKFRLLSEAGKIASKDYEVTRCEECGAKGINHTWGLDFVSMASRVKGIGGMIVECYYDPLAHSHQSLHSIMTRMRRDGTGMWFDDGPQAELADSAVRNGHYVLLSIIKVAIDRFGMSDLTELFEECYRDFRDAWLPETTRGAGREAGGSEVT